MERHFDLSPPLDHALTVILSVPQEIEFSCIGSLLLGVIAAPLVDGGRRTVFTPRES